MYPRCVNPTLWSSSIEVHLGLLDLMVPALDSVSLRCLVEEELVCLLLMMM